MPYIILVIYLSLASVIQLLTGDFPASLMAFPLNLIIFILWVSTISMLWKKRMESAFVRFMLSPAATYCAVGLFIAFCLVVGITGYRWLVGTWTFVAFMLFFQTVLVYVILRGWRKPAAESRLKSVRWRFLFLHLGLLVAVASPYWGAPDSETLKLQAYEGVPVAEAYAEDGKTVWLDRQLVLDDFKVSYGPDGMPDDYSASVMVGDEKAVLRVNHPYSMSIGNDLYLSSYDVAEGKYCILMIVREPWRYCALAGILMMLTGAFMLFVLGPRGRNKEQD